MKKELKVYLENSEVKELERKANEVSISGRGWLSNFLRMLAKEDIVFLNDNVKKLMRNFDFKQNVYT